MITGSFEKILNRDMSRVLAKNVSQVAVPLITDIVDDATYVFARCLDSSKRRKGAHEPALFSYLHMIEITDAAAVLVSESCSTPITFLLRSSFEALLTIKYLLDNDYERRSLAYLVCSAHRRQSMYHLFDPLAPEGKEFIYDWDRDLRKYWRGKSIVSVKEEARQANEKIQKLLKQERYTEVEEEYKRLNGKKHRRVEWYHLFNGPRNLRELARLFYYGARYDLLYRSWATVSHAMGISRFMAKQKDGSTIIKQLRDPGDLAAFSGLAVSFILEARQLILSKFHPGEEISTERWYRKNIRSKYLGLAKHKE